MKPKSYLYLTWSAISQFGDRKKAGRFSILINANTKDVFAVPRNMEHKDFLCGLLRTTAEALTEQPELITHLIPVHIDLKPDSIEIITGLSGFEQVYHVRHTRDNLHAAHQRAKAFVAQGEVEYQTLEEKIDYRYALK